MAPQGSETEALAPGSDPQSLAPPWRLLLLSDGSVTRHLSLLTQSDVRVDCVGMDPHDDADPLPPEAEAMGRGLLLRQVTGRACAPTAGHPRTLPSPKAYSVLLVSRGAPR